MLPLALQSLLEYYRPLSSFSRHWPGGESLLAPGTNLLGANAAYLPEDASLASLEAARDWASSHDLPALRPQLGAQGEAATLRVGTYQADFYGADSQAAIQVEQLSRLHLPRWAAVLAEAHGQPEWAAPIARHLAAKLEPPTNAALLLAYAGHEAVGALLWQVSGAHLWGTLDTGVDAPLLNAAAGLSGGTVLVSLPDSSPAAVQDAQIISFAHLR